MIQNSINQLLATAGMAARLSPLYERRQEKVATQRTAKDAITRAQAAEQGIKDIEKNLSNPEKEYSETELADIKSRVFAHNKAIYDAKTMYLDPKYKEFMENDIKQIPGQKVYRPMLESIEARMAEREAYQKADNTWRDRALSEIIRIRDFKKHKDNIYGQGGL